MPPTLTYFCNFSFNMEIKRNEVETELVHTNSYLILGKWFGKTSGQNFYYPKVR